MKSVTKSPPERFRNIHKISTFGKTSPLKFTLSKATAFETCLPVSHLILHRTERERKAQVTLRFHSYFPIWK